jgi:hypothetical protein
MEVSSMRLYATHTPPRAGTDGSMPAALWRFINLNNLSNEIIFAAQFTQNLALAGLNNQTHMFYLMQYDGGIAIPGMDKGLF